MMNVLCYIIPGIIYPLIINAVRIKLHNKKKHSLNIEELKLYLEYVYQEFYSNNEAEKPNIIIFFTDDVRYADISCNEAQNIKTRIIDNFSEGGLKMNCLYSSSPICSLSRVGLLICYHSLKMYIRYFFFPKRSIKSEFIMIKLRGLYRVEGLLVDEIIIA